MNTFGDPKFSFRDPRAPQWAMLILGIALALAGGLILLVLMLDGMSGSAADMIGGVVFVGMLLVGGVVLTSFGLRDLVGAPEWHVTATHAYRTRGTTVVRSIVLREQETPTLKKFVRAGQLISVHVRFGRTTIVVPNMDVANGIVNAWRNAKGA